jgi:hypothetical protein
MNTSSKAAVYLEARSEEGLVDPAELHPSGFPREHLHLVPTDDDLDLQFSIRTRTTGPDHAAEQRVQESEQHEGAVLHRRWSGRRVRENAPFSR